MEYELAAELTASPEAPELDELQRLGAATLLDEQLDLVAGMEGPDGVEVEPIDHRVAVHPGGALLTWVLDAPALAFAEDAARAVLSELLERTELLSAWSVTRCEVTASDDDLASAVNGPPGTDDDGHTDDADDTENADGDDADDDALAPDEVDYRRASLRAAAAQLRAFGPAAFGHDPATTGDTATADDTATDDTVAGDGAAVTAEHARLAAGALVQGMEILTDELFADIQALHDSGLPVAELDVLWVLDELPEQPAHAYTELFAKQFLVMTAVLGYRLCRDDWTGPLCPAESLALHLAMARAEGQLELAGLLDELPLDAIHAAFAVAAGIEGAEALYEDEDEGGDPADWFRQHTGDALHPYLTDEV